MPRALHTAATGMLAQQFKIDVIANNLANVNTTGFKRARLEFQDLLYQTLRIAGAGSTRDTESPLGLQVGHGTRAVATERSFTPGDPHVTDNPLDVAIEGAGMFQVRLPSGEIVYTRAGSLKLDSRGQMVTVDGYQIEPPIVVPEDTVQITIGRDGIVNGVAADRKTATELGQLELAHVLNTGAYEAMGRNLFRLRGNPGEIIVGRPGELGLGTVAQGFLEGSNVRVVEEMVAMIMSQRSYEASSRVISTADKMLEDVNRLR